MIHRQRRRPAQLLGKDTLHDLQCESSRYRGWATTHFDSDLHRLDDLGHRGAGGSKLRADYFAGDNDQSPAS